MKVKRVKITILSLLFVSCNAGLDAQIRSMDYWFDDKPDEYKNIQVSAVDKIIESNIDTEGLTLGIHQLHYRLKDNEGLLSQVLSSYFFKYPKTEAINQFEYWYNDDYNNRKAVSVTSGDITLLLDTDDLEFGVNMLHYRVKTSADVWSSVASTLFFKINKQGTNESEALVEGYRYWFNNDLSHVQSVALESKQAQVNLILGLNVPRSLPIYSVHTISIQFYDNRGHWSQIVEGTFQKTAHQVGLEENVNDDGCLVYFNNDKGMLVIENGHNNLMIYTIGGNVIYNKQNIEILEEIDISGWINGIYIIEVGTSDNKVKTLKIIK